MPVAELRKRLQSGEHLRGSFVQMPTPVAVELCGLVGFDFVVIDAEHSEVDLETTANMIRGANSVNIPAIVRCAVNEPQTILRYMDMGAAGIQIPQIETAFHAKQVVESVKYRPFGRRGLASVRAAGYLVNTSLDNYIAHVNEETLVVVQIENLEAVKSLPEIVQIPGIDVLFIGPTDLSYSMGYPGQVHHPEVRQAFMQIIEAARQAGIASGILASSPDDAKEFISLGVQYITTSDKGLLISAARQYLAGKKKVSNV